jgi:transcription elongation factor GreA
MDQIKMTQAELTTLREELSQLEGDARTEMAKRIKTAREWGDLSENAEYHAAKEAQAHLETKILRLRGQLRAAEVVEHTDSEIVQHGSTVSVTDLRNDHDQSFTIVSPHEADPKVGRISASSPVARALVGLTVGDVAEITIPAGVRPLRVNAIS